jgi:hypothetical protein
MTPSKNPLPRMAFSRSTVRSRSAPPSDVVIFESQRQIKAPIGWAWRLTIVLGCSQLEARRDSRRATYQALFRRVQSA